MGPYRWLASLAVPDYSRDVLQGDWRRRRSIPEVTAEPGLVVEDAASGFCGAVIGVGKSGVRLEDRNGRVREIPLTPAGFLVDGVATTLVRPAAAPAA